MSRSPDDVVPVVVVGGGPTGVTAALLLARHGVPSLVLDRWDGVHPQPRAVHLDDEVYRILGRIGVAEGFARISRPALGLRLVDRELRTLAEFRRAGDGGRHGFPQANMFDQPDLERLLRDAAAAHPLVTLRVNSTVTSVRDEGTQIAISFTDRLAGEARVVRAGHVLGCDGANSLVRAQMGSAMKDLGFEQRWLVVDVQTDLELGHWDGVHQVCDPGRAATYMRVGTSRHRWEFRLAAGESAADHASVAALGTLISPWLPDGSTDGLTVLRVAEYTFHAQVADRWRAGRIFLLGDAAHLTPPFIGQGLGAGLRDAENLSWKLAGVIQGRLDDDALDTYQSERKAHAVSMIRLAVLTGRVMTGGGRLGSLLRRVIAPRVHLVPGIRRKIVDSASPRLHRSTLVRRSLPLVSLAGTLCPNAELDGGTRLDAFSASFVVLTLDEVSPDETAPGDVAVVRVGASTPLGRWLRRHAARAAVIRPDGTVLSTRRSVGKALASLPLGRSGAGTGAADRHHPVGTRKESR